VKSLVAATGLALGIAATAASAAGTTQRPNIVFMMVDNLGYGDVGVYGGGDVRGAPTPRLDQLAAEGMRFTNFNVEAECTPSRSAFMTGRMPIRSGTSRVALPPLPQGIAPWEYTIAELLHDAGYESAMYGKWHLGDRPGRMPNDQGFDEWWGFAYSSGETVNELQPGWSPELAPIQKILQGTRGEPSVAVGEYNYAMRPLMDEAITRKSVDYIKAHARDDKPFFLYVPFSLPHSPPLPNPKFRDPRRTDYQNVLVEIDHNAGEILDALKTAGIEGNTIVVWTSDNGPQTHLGPGFPYGAAGDPGPFRGEFPSAWEGAIRTPCIIRWPGQVKPGRVSNEIVSILDFYRTFARIAGAAERVPTDRPIDSIDQTDFLLGRQEKSSRESVMFFYERDLLAIKWRNYKVHMVVREPSRGDVRVPGQSEITAYAATPTYPWIFDVTNDPKELWNIGPSSIWLGRPVGKINVAYARSVQQFPNLEPGSDGPKPAQ
jgi:arylsulfatase A-like enzyme